MEKIYLEDFRTNLFEIHFIINIMSYADVTKGKKNGCELL